MQAGAKAKVGERVRIRLEPDLEERAVVTPPELKRALKGDRRLPKWFAGLCDSMRGEIGKWVNEPKSAETRRKRAERMAERLLLTLEGEIEPPPILQAAFLRQPLARKGWEAMTPVQRRGICWASSTTRASNARERRAAKAVEEALRVAKKYLAHQVRPLAPNPHAANRRENDFGTESMFLRRLSGKILSSN